MVRSYLNHFKSVALTSTLEYSDLDPAVCAELVIRAKQTNQPPPNQYSGPQSAGGYGVQQQQQPPQYGYGGPQAQQQPALGNNANIAQLLSSLNPQELQNVLSAAGIQQPQTPQTPHQQQQPGMSADLARLLAGAGVSNGNAHPAQGYNQSPPQSANSQQSPFNALASNPALASLLGGTGGAAPAQAAPAPAAASQPDMQEIMAQLAKYKR